jgi:hypothetical protein
MVTLTPGSIGQCPVANLFFRRLHARVGRTLAMPKSPAFCTKSFSPTAVRPRRKKERKKERDGRKGAQAQSRRLGWEYAHLCCATRRLCNLPLSPFRPACSIFSFVFGGTSDCYIDRLCVYLIKQKGNTESHQLYTIYIKDQRLIQLNTNRRK